MDAYHCLFAPGLGSDNQLKVSQPLIVYQDFLIWLIVPRLVQSSPHAIAVDAQLKQKMQKQIYVWYLAWQYVCKPIKERRTIIIQPDFSTGVYHMYIYNLA